VGIICVTGMHRAGTSVLARAVHLLGADLGPERWLLPANDDNPRGYWEDNRVVQLNDQLLGFLGGWWHDPPTLLGEWAGEWRLEPFRVWAAQLVAERAPVLDAGQPCGFKDPRLCLLLPFWRYAAAVDRTVISVRDPREVVDSLTRRDGLSPEEGAQLWLRYTAAAVVNAPDALAVRYEDWFSAIGGTLGAVASHLGLEPPGAALVDELSAFVEPALRRSSARSAPGSGGRQLAAALEVHEELTTGPVAGSVPVMVELLDRVQGPERGQA
jgi:hypothetical protein